MTDTYEQVAKLRQDALKRDQYRCRLCNQPGTEHDLGIYPTLGGTGTIGLNEVITAHLKCQP